MCPLYKLNLIRVCVYVQEETVCIQVKVCVLLPAIVCIHGEIWVVYHIYNHILGCI